MSKREDIFVALDIAVAAIPSVVNTTRQINIFENLPDVAFPIVQILDNGDNNVGGWTSGFMSTTIDIDLKIITKAEYATNATDLNAVDSDIVAALANNLTMGGLVDAVRIEARGNDDIEQTYPFVAVSRKLLITYSAPLTSGL